MLNHPDTESPTPSSGKLVLPDLSDEEQREASGLHRAHIHPGLLIRPTTSPAPAKVLPKLVWYWRKDPAYKVFIIAIATVVVASLVFVSLVSAALFGHSSPGTTLSQTPPGKVTPAGTVDLHPTFPKPTGGNGPSQSSQPPAQSTPVVGPGNTPTAGPTVTVQPGGQLTLQITGYPATVANSSTYPITVTTNQPGITVYLQIHYNAPSLRSYAGPGTTDANGIVTIPWTVSVFSFNHKNVQATLRAIGTDQNGQQVASPPVVVQVLIGPGTGG